MKKMEGLYLFDIRIKYLFDIRIKLCFINLVENETLVARREVGGTK
jgi:hypothetical protein